MVLAVEVNLKQRVLSILERHYGHRNAIKGKELALLCDVDDRTVQQVIVELTDNGVPVCSACSFPMGYYLPETIQEAEEFKHQMRSRALGDFRRYKKFKMAFNQWFYGNPQRKLL